MGLDSVVDVDTKCGVQFNRCCHYFHTDCLRDYITAEFNKTHQAQYVQSMIGLEDNMIQCPLCKGISNTYMPYLPATSDTKDLLPYIDLFSQLLGTP
jgi:5'-3' exonuclease